MGLAAFRLARNELDMDYDEAVTWAKQLIYDAHFLYGKFNLPSAVRGSTEGKLLRPFYTFRSFTHNYLDMISHMLFNQGWSGRLAAARSLRDVRAKSREVSNGAACRMAGLMRVEIGGVANEFMASVV